MTVKKGDIYVWNNAVTVEVNRVAADGSWADITCQARERYIGAGSVWCKRQPLPFPDGFVQQET